MMCTCKFERVTKIPPLMFLKVRSSSFCASVLLITKGPADINIAKISHLSNVSDVKLWFIFIYEHNKPEQTYSVIVYHIFQI